MLFRCAIQLSVCSERWAELSTWPAQSFELDCLLVAVRMWRTMDIKSIIHQYDPSLKSCR